MRGDFSRLTFDRTKHYSGVLMQQGRVLTDADWNEQVDILLHQLRTTTRDIIGWHGTVDAHGEAPGGDGFRITQERNGIRIGRGRYYVNGILCENDALSASVALERQPHSDLVAPAYDPARPALLSPPSPARACPASRREPERPRTSGGEQQAVVTPSFPIKNCSCSLRLWSPRGAPQLVANAMIDPRTRTFAAPGTA